MKWNNRIWKNTILWEYRRKAKRWDKSKVLFLYSWLNKIFIKTFKSLDFGMNVTFVTYNSALVNWSTPFKLRTVLKEKASIFFSILSMSWVWSSSWIRTRYTLSGIDYIIFTSGVCLTFVLVKFKMDLYLLYIEQ